MLRINYRYSQHSRESLPFAIIGIHRCPGQHGPIASSCTLHHRVVWITARQSLTWQVLSYTTAINLITGQSMIVLTTRISYGQSTMEMNYHKHSPLAVCTLNCSRDISKTSKTSPVM